MFLAQVPDPPIHPGQTPEPHQGQGSLPTLPHPHKQSIRDTGGPGEAESTLPSVSPAVLGAGGKSTPTLTRALLSSLAGLSLHPRMNVMCTFNKIFLGRRLAFLCPEAALGCREGSEQ